MLQYVQPATHEIVAVHGWDDVSAIRSDADTPTVMRNRREHTRYSVPGAYVTEGLSWRAPRRREIGPEATRCKVIDVGRGGLSFVCALVPREGERILCDLFMPDETEPHTVDGVVAWVGESSTLPPDDVGRIWRHSSLFAGARVGVKSEQIPESLATRIEELGVALN